MERSVLSRAGMRTSSLATGTVVSACVMSLFVTSLPACSSPDASSGTVGAAVSPIISGVKDDAYPAVVMLVNYGTDPKNVTSCTGTVVTPHVVVTAAHCVFPEVTGPVAETYVFVGTDSTDKAQTDNRANWFRARETRFHVGYKGASVPGHDIGVVITKDAMTVRPMRFRTEPIALDVVKDQPMVAIGYGLTDATNAASSGIRMRADVKIGNVLGEDLVSVTKGTLCHGDSGGALVWKVGGIHTLVGIHAFVSTETCSGANYATRPDMYAADYISPIAEEFDPGYLANPPPEEPADAGIDASADAGKPDAASPATPSTAPESGCTMPAYGPDGTSMAAPGLAVVALSVAFGTRRRRQAAGTG